MAQSQYAARNRRSSNVSARVLYALAGICVALGVFALTLGSWYGLFFGTAFGTVFYAVARYAGRQAGRPGVYGRARQSYREVPPRGRAAQEPILPTEPAERDEAVARPRQNESDVHRGAPFGEERRP